MFSVNVIRNNFLKSSFWVVHPIRKNLRIEKGQSWIENVLGHGLPPDFQKVNNLKLTPKGYEAIYFSPMEPFLKWMRRITPFFWACFAFDFYTFLTEEDYMERVKENFKYFTSKDKVWISITFIVLFITLQILQGMVVLAIYRKGNEFQSLMHGLLPPLTRKYVPHGFNVMEPTRIGAVYKFKGKDVIIFSHGFRSIEDLRSVLKLNA